VVSNTVGCCMQKFIISGVFGKETFKLSVCPIWRFFVWLTSLLSTSSGTHCISWLALALLYFFRCKEMWVRDVYGIVQLVWRKQKHTLWRRPIINQSSTAILLCIFVTSWFVTNDSSFLLGLLCYGWLSFCDHESSLHKVFTYIASRFVTDHNSFVLSFLCFCYRWFSFCNHESSLHRVFFYLIVCFCFFFGLCLLVFSFSLYFWWMGSLDFHLQGFFFFWTLLCQGSDMWGKRVTQNWKQKGICPLFSLSQKRLKNDIPLFLIISSLSFVMLKKAGRVVWLLAPFAFNK